MVAKGKGLAIAYIKKLNETAQNIILILLLTVRERNQLNRKLKGTISACQLF
jgi:hypothetical protein